MHRLPLAVITLGACLAACSATAAEETLPRGYVCHKVTAKPPKIDGKLDDKAWANIPWTADFRDIEGDKKPVPRFRTRAKMTWDDQCLYIAAELEEPHVWATITKRDEVIFRDNDFEVFIDPNADNIEYAELEVNAFGTPWDLLLPIPYKDGGNPMDGWDITGLKVATAVQGTINNPADTDKGWTVEIAIPWKGMAIPAHTKEPPKDGDQWRIDFSRVEWQVNVKDGKYEKVPGTPENNWIWSPIGIVDMHRPERWGILQFSTAPAGTAVALHPVPFAKERAALMELYYAQRDFYAKNARWAKTPEELGLKQTPAPKIEITDIGWRAALDVTLPDGSKKIATIRQDSWLRVEDPEKK